ncbi:MAG: valine--tRNA ligase, partial [Beijerinckiaceae bacterium]
RYPLDGVTFDAGNPETFLVVATTRPETMLGDTAVAVSPEHPKYAPWIGRLLTLPLVGRNIPIVGDDYADPEKGTGAVKITPAHDFNDFEVGRRHADKLIDPVNIFDEHACLNNDVPEAFRGMERFAARKAVVEAMHALGFLEKIEIHPHTVPHGDRSGVVVEPYLTDQWYVNAGELAKEALAAVRDGRTKFVPKNWEKTYFDWLENIQPWCISRQLWWGHQIPAWYGPDGEVFVAETENLALGAAESHYGTRVSLTRDEDVLDTWFSSALWPFSTLGWPDESDPALKRFYPTSVLVTGFDIIFFWVARMMMMGLYFMKDVPFHDIYIHALVRDEKGAKMSKSKGNVIDPLELIDAYGADALRFTLAAMAAQGRDIKLATSRVEGYRSFATKFWNASRFAEMNGCVRVAGFDPHALNETLNVWIVGELARAASETSAAIEAYRFNDAANAVYRFVWNVFCDWYVELTKPVLQGPDGPAKTEVRAATAFVIDEICKLLHPFMPFITEELWAIKGSEGPARESVLALAQWPSFEGLEAAAAEAEVGFVVDLVSDIRSVRAEMRVPAGAQMPLVLVNASEEARGWTQKWRDMIARLARLSDISFSAEPPAESAQMIVRGTVAALPLAGVVDISAEKDRLAKEIGREEGEVKKIDAKLNNENFVARAPEEVVEENRERREDIQSRIAKMKLALERLG